MNYLFPNLTIRLGSVYCFNRPCHLLHCLPQQLPHAAGSADDDGATDSTGAEAGPSGKAAPSVVELQKLVMEPRLDSAMEPRFSPDGADLVFISHQQVRELRRLSSD